LNETKKWVISIVKMCYNKTKQNFKQLSKIQNVAICKRKLMTCGTTVTFAQIRPDDV